MSTRLREKLETIAKEIGLAWDDVKDMDVKDFAVLVASARRARKAAAS